MYVTPAYTPALVVDERVTETRIKYVVTAGDQSAHEPLFSLDPTEGFSPDFAFASRALTRGLCESSVRELLYIHRDDVYVAIELSHSPPRYYVYLDSRRKINYAK